MTANKLLSRRFITHLLSSIQKDHSKCHICSLAKDSVQFGPGQIGLVARGGAKADFSSRLLLVGVSLAKQELQNSVRLSSSFRSGHSSLKREASTHAQHQEMAIEEQVPEQKSYCSSFRSSDLEIIKLPPSELAQKPNVDSLVFGKYFSDHMFRVDWDEENGWSSPMISKLHNLDVHPAAKALHYAQQAFEGIKAFRGHDNTIRFFRLGQHIRRLLSSTRALALPEFDEAELIKCIHKLVQIDQDWVPSSQNKLTSLYLRPVVLGMEPSLGVASSKKAMLYVLLSPVGPYFKTGFKPVSLYADPSVVRAWPGGAGNNKLGSNYAPTVKIQMEAEKQGQQQVLWLFESKLTEVGTMNIFIVYKQEKSGQLHLVTPPLSDKLILPGITRASILELARQWTDVVCEERYLTISEVEQMIHENRLVEMFGSGTACVVCPISSIDIEGGRKINIPFSDIVGNDIATSSSYYYDEPVLTKRILKAITDIQYGRVPHRWADVLMDH